MKIVLQEDLFGAEVSTYTPFFLKSVFEICAQRGHVIRLGFDSEASQAFGAWREALTPDERDFAQSYLSSSLGADLRGNHASVAIATIAPSNWSEEPPLVNHGEVQRLLNEPLTILVENEISDGAFLRTMGFGVHADAFVEAVRSDQIRIDHAGGAPMTDLIRRWAKDPVRRFRLWAIFDSDALVPERPDKPAVEKENACRALRVKHRMLKRRAIENYLPHDYLLERTPHSLETIERRKALAALGRLQHFHPKAHHHYFMKKGFAGDEKRLREVDAALYPEVEKLFSAVPPDDRALLGSGFGRDLSELFEPARDQGPPAIPEPFRRKDCQDAEMVPLFREIIESL